MSGNVGFREMWIWIVWITQLLGSGAELCTTPAFLKCVAVVREEPKTLALAADKAEVGRVLVYAVA
jgi:hypothetical protein